MQYRQTSHGGANRSRIFIGVALVLLLIFLLSLMATTAERVTAGNHCVVLKNKDIDYTADPGFHWTTPFITDFHCYETRVINLETGAVEGSKANYTDSAMRLTTADGVVMELTSMLYFRLEPDALEDMFRLYGRSTDAVVEKHVQQEVRDSVRDTLETMTASEAYLDGGKERISVAVRSQLGTELDEKGISVTDFEITSVTPTKTFADAVALQVEQQQEAKLEQERQAVAAQKAETQRVTAEGDAQAKRVAVEADNQNLLSRTQAEAEALTIATEAEAAANERLAETLTPEVLQAKAYETLATVQWAILGAEGAMPTLPIPTPEPSE